MKFSMRTSLFFFFTASLVAFPLAVIHFGGMEAQAQSSYFTSRGCASCHSTPVVATCNGCHYHGNRTLRAATNKTSYSPGETVTVTLTSGSTRSGWIKAILYDQSNTQIAVSNGNASGMGGSTTFPASLSAPAPTSPGTYTWKMAYYGNSANTGSTHGEVAVSTNSFTVAAAADTTAPVVGAFTLPATATSLTVPVSSFTATDNVGVTGYLITTSATAPAASAAGWSATAPTSVTAVAGTNTFYAWAKDAAGNVSLSRSATVTVTLPDTTAPVVGAFTLPATATSLTVPVSSFTATDNVGVTGYLITTSATAPAASAAGWSATAPTSVTAVAGTNTFYAWAKDAAGNVSLSRSATVTVTLPSGDTTKPTLTISALSNGAYTNKVTLNITGTTSDASGIKSVTVNGQPVTVNPDGSFGTALTLAVGANTITVVSTDNAGNQQTDTRIVTYDPTAPALAVTAPADNSQSSQSFVTINGTIGETSTVSVTVNNGSPQLASISGNSFSATVNLAQGVNTIVITATDLAGNVSTAKRTVTYGAVSMGLAITYPSQDITTKYPSIVLKGTVIDPLEKVTVTITMDGRTYTPAVDDGVFKQRLVFSTPKLYAITITAKDEAGNSSTVYRNVIYKPEVRDDEHDDD
ncbi:MAG: hypothetical protein ED859_05835 [Desulfuromonadales bacterium]|nr:MAG: hypothetical protein ED859_05835 [Desulfuromonadales bacterium]